MHKTHPTIAALAAVTIAFAACEPRAGEETGAAGEDVAVDTADLETELDEFRSGYEEAWNARDWDAVVVMHTEDYQEVTPEGETMGYGDIETAMQDTAQAPPEDARLAIDIESMEIADSGELAYATGTSTVTATGPDGQPMTINEYWMAGFERVDGEWKLDRLVRTAAGGSVTMPAPGAGAPTTPMDEPAGGAMEEADTTAM